MTNTFNYDDAKQTVARINELTDQLNNILTNMNAIVDENVNNRSVWSGEAATSYKQKWDQFYNDNKENFINTFKIQSNNVSDAIDKYHAWEQQNM